MSVSQICGIENVQIPSVCGTVLSIEANMFRNLLDKFDPYFVSSIYFDYVMD